MPAPALMDWPGLPHINERASRERRRHRQADPKDGESPLRGVDMNAIHGSICPMGRINSLQAGILLLILAALPSLAQTAPPKPAVTTPSAGGNSFDGPGDVRYESDRDVQDRRIDMFIGDWRDSLPRHAYGSLVLRDILTHGDNFAPPQPGAILQAANYLAYGRLVPQDSTIPTKLDHEQNVFYVVGGNGEISAGGRTVALHKDTAVFVPANLEFVMKNTGNDDLKMYVVSE